MRADAVIWDLDNTLFDRDAAFARWVARLPITLTPAERATLRRLDDRGQGARATLFEWMSATWPVLGPPDALWAAMRKAIPRFAEPAPGLAAVIARWPYRVLTNGSGALQRAKAAAIGLPLDRLLISGELGVAKPDARAFAAATALVGPDAVMIGDDPYCDIIGARRAGLRTVWLRRGRAWPAEHPPPDRIIDAVEELL